jgi:hypothetical protein
VQRPGLVVELVYAPEARPSPRGRPTGFHGRPALRTARWHLRQRLSPAQDAGTPGGRTVAASINASQKTVTTMAPDTPTIVFGHGDVGRRHPLLRSDSAAKESWPSQPALPSSTRQPSGSTRSRPVIHTAMTTPRHGPESLGRRGHVAARRRRRRCPRSNDGTAGRANDPMAGLRG